LSLLGKDWKPNLTVSSLALSILSMLSSAKEKRTPQVPQTHLMD
jgi:ubiquitin-conjugating enzyme E2 W